MDLDNQLAQLENEQFVRRVDSPDLTYIFKHLLTQEAVYQSLLLKRRRDIHLRVAQGYERLYPDRLDEFAALLAQHYAAAGDDAKTLKYATHAGNAAARIYANIEAEAHYTRALEVAQRSDYSSDQIVHLYTSRGRVLELSGRYDEALKDYSELVKVAVTRRDRAMELAGLLASATILSTQTPVQNPVQAQSALRQALALARELGDPAAESRVLWNLMLLSTFADGDLQEAITYGEQSLALARQLDSREQLAFALHDLFYAYLGTGNTARALQVVEEARALWRELGNLPMLADNLSNSVLLHVLTGDYASAISLSEEALRISQSIDNVWGQTCSRWVIGNVYLERGELDKAIQIMEQAIQLGEQSGHPGAFIATRAELGWVYGTLGASQHGLELVRLARSRSVRAKSSVFRPWAIANLARVHVLNGDLALAEQVLREGYQSVREQRLQLHGPMLLALTEGELAFARGDYAHALEVTESVLGYLRQSQTRLFMADVLYLKGRAALALGRIEKAYVILMEARAEAEAMSARRILWQILVALSDIEAQRGNATDAHRLRAAAREIINYIADHTPSPDLRTSFLNLPSVRAALAS